METIGNQRGEERYGKEKVSPGASKEQKQQHVIDKYEKRLFVDKPDPISQHANSIVHKIGQTRQKPAPSEACRLRAKKQSDEVEKMSASKFKVQEISQSLFDDLFAEAHETCVVEEVVVTKQGEIATRLASNHSNNLNDFLDSMLCAETETTINKESSSPTSDAPNQGVQTAAAIWEDPFFDWAL
jgi:hypothetical protein